MIIHFNNLEKVDILRKINKVKIQGCFEGTINKKPVKIATANFLELEIYSYSEIIGELKPFFDSFSVKQAGIETIYREIDSIMFIEFDEENSMKSSNLEEEIEEC